MSKLKDQPAFPTMEEQDRNMVTTPGMTLRHYFAGQAMVGLCNGAGDNEVDKWNYILLARCAVKAADALIAELEKPQQ